jgi:hypothetical protein
MEKKFELGQSNEILKGGRIYDLHNMYDFTGIYVGANRDVHISFQANAEQGRGQPSLALVFSGVDYLEFSPGFGARAVQDLDELGYKSPDDRDDEWLLTEQQATPGDHLFLRFGGGDFIRVHSQQARLRILNERTNQDGTG